MDAQQTIEAALEAIGANGRVSAKAFCTAVEAQLIELGCSVRREVKVQYRATRSGRVDLVVDAPFRAAIELDNWTPREKSIAKLRKFDCACFVALRNSPEALIVL